MTRIEQIRKRYFVSSTDGDGSIYDDVAYLLAIVDGYKAALEKIESNHNMTIMNISEEFMDGAHDGYSRQAEIAREALKGDE